MTAAATLTISLWERYRTQGDLEARSQLLSQYLGLVHHIARQVAVRLPDEVELDDLVSAGTIGLVLALESFELDRGLAFSTYATARIRGAILDELRSRDWIPRSVRAKRRRIDKAVQNLEAKFGRPPRPQDIADMLEIDLETFWRWKEEAEGGTLVSFNSAPSWNSGETHSREDLVGDQSLADPMDAITRGEDVAVVRDAIAELPSRERTVLALYYYEELNLRQIAEVLHLTESRISQIRTQVLKRLRERFSGGGFA
jgi:RNA polymerase sigma factor FliA